MGRACLTNIETNEPSNNTQPVNVEISILKGVLALQPVLMPIFIS